MRTNQQLGYGVWGGTAIRRQSAYIIFMIQSGDYPADELEARADAFIAGFPQMLRSMPPEAFAAYKAAAAEKLKEKQKSIAGKARKFNTEAFDYDGQFDRDARALEALESLTQEEVATILERALAEESRQLVTLLGFARHHNATREMDASWEDLEAWKKERVYGR